ncbi:hypothetical protein ACLOJK_007696 [Asimina triloba]
MVRSCPSMDGTNCAPQRGHKTSFCPRCIGTNVTPPIFNSFSTARTCKQVLGTPRISASELIRPFSKPLESPEQKQMLEERNNCPYENQVIEASREQNSLCPIAGSATALRCMLGVGGTNTARKPIAVFGVSISRRSSRSTKSHLSYYHP